MHTRIRTHQNTVLDLDNINRVDFDFSEKQLLWMMLFLLGMKGEMTPVTVALEWPSLQVGHRIMASEHLSGINFK
jgi:hypothetical protein